MQQELIEMLEEIIQYVEVWHHEDGEALDRAEALVEKAKKSAKEPAAPDVMSILRAIHHRPSDAGIWLDDITRILRDAPAPAVPQGEPVLVQHRKPIVGKDGETIGYTNWIDGNGLDWWPHRSLYAAPSQGPVTDEYAGVIAWVGDKQCKLVITEGAIKHEHTPGVAMRNAAHQCVQEVIIAALREKEAKATP